MTVVLDTNVIISATLVRGGKEDHVLRAWQRGAFELVLSPPILEELARALLYEKLRRFRWMTDAEIRDLLQALAAGSFLASGEAKAKASRDPDDDKFLPRRWTLARDSSSPAIVISSTSSGTRTSASCVREDFSRF